MMERLTTPAAATSTGLPVYSGPLKKLINKLAEYEDAEEAGLLVRLPCKVGDTLYRIYTTYEELETGVDELTYAPRVEAVVVEDICLSRSARYITVLTERLGWHIRYALSDVRKYLFSTAEEAERALKAADRHE